MGDQINNLSVPLYRVLVKVGASERIRQLHQQTAITKEILSTLDDTFLFWIRHIIYNCGSSFEGSVTPDLVSDHDVVSCFAVPPVVLDVATAPPGASYLMVRDRWTPPGYCKLQAMVNGQLVYDNNLLNPEIVGIDQKGRACRKHMQRETMQGPADVEIDEYGVHFLDFVPAYECQHIPLSDLQWIMRPRPYNWPSCEQLQKMVRLGCIFVGVGHVKSSERELEWRISYSLQERILMTHLNPTQHKVYILLKMIKKNIFRDLFHEESLSSYHFKTCLLYAVQMTPARAWTPFNLINCLLQCLKLMERWLQACYCPGFLIKDQNLFAKKEFVHARHRLLGVIRFIFRGGRQFLYMLHSDNVGTILRDGDCRMVREIRIKNKKELIFRLNAKQIRSVSFLQLRLIQTLSAGRVDPFSLAYVLFNLKKEDQVLVSGHTVEETHSALEYLFPWFHLHIANGLVNIAYTCTSLNEATKAQLERAADFHLDEARRADLVNSRLAKATLMYACGQYEECYLLLQVLENEFAFLAILFCPCTRRHVCPVYCIQDRHWRNRKLAKLSVHQIIRSHTACCVIFMPSAAAIVPEPLTYEMLRSVDTPPGSRDEKKDFWFDWAAVDARSYLYFLQYLVCTKLQRDVYRQVARDNLRTEILTDDGIVARGDATWLGHKETSCNLLGWIYMQEGRLDEALVCFEESLQIRPLHNAAKHHMRDWLRMTSERAMQN